MELTTKTIDVSVLSELINADNVSLSSDCKDRILKSRAYLESRLESGKEVFYGINTGFGSLCNTVIEPNELEKLQYNLVRSHACGLGEEVPQNIVRLMLLLKARGLSFGYSGVQLETVERILYLFNNNIVPVVYQQGSLGASGDLAPLAHLSMALIGEGEVYYEGVKTDTKAVYQKLGLEPIRLKAKEGLALLNGTQFMSAYGLHCIMESEKLIAWSDKIAAMSIDAFDCRMSPFGNKVNVVRNQNGQIETAKIIRELLDGSEISVREKTAVQDPYSFRCIPQVHGATKDAFKYVKSILEAELNGATDNPTIIPEEDDIVSAGNFHGQPLALSLDFLAIAMAELANISERRTYQMIGGERGLPAFLVANPGINSGFMIPQYAAASVVSQNKQLCTPSSVDSIESSNGQEDHVSMGANAATKLFRVIENVYKVLGVELLNSAQALEFRRPMKSSETIEKMFAEYRNEVPYVVEDTYLHELMIKSIEFIKK